MLDLDGFKLYLDRMGFGSVNNYVSYIKMLLKILGDIEIYQNLTDKEKILKFAKEENNFKEIFNQYHNYASSNTFNDLRSGARKYSEYLKSNHEATERDSLRINDIQLTNTKNIILYGPPGVGKTYNHKKLISLIESRKNQKEIFDAIKNNDFNGDEDLFEEVKKEDRFKFVTFHQSYSYEDFIEGFRPLEDGNISLEDGIFKSIAKQAEENLIKSHKNQPVTFNDALNLLLKEPIENEKTVTINMKSGNKDFHIYDYNNKTIFFQKHNGDKSHSLSIKTLERMYNEGKNNIIQGGLAPYYNPLLNELLEIKKQHTSETVERKNFYILIDEINRGNISKIFGELITLIEDDKRDEIEVTLPYSKEAFKVPSNLYIIATMNSTDKSIALIDVALRRRFTFLKMEPKESLVHLEVIELFIKLNKLIKEKLGSDYQLGHSYFMGEDFDWEFVKEYKIKPLLEEYFYADEEGLTEALAILD